MTLRHAAAVLVAIAASLSCGGVTVSGPPALHAGADVCDGCGMAFSDTRCGATRRSAGTGEARWLLFDDIDCLLRWEGAHSGGATGTTFLRDHARDAWIDASVAIVVRADASLTPMGSGLLAFASPAEAETFAAEHGGATVPWERVAASPSRDETSETEVPR